MVLGDNLAVIAAHPFGAAVGVPFVLPNWNVALDAVHYGGDGGEGFAAMRRAGRNGNGQVANGQGAVTMDNGHARQLVPLQGVARNCEQQPFGHGGVGLVAEADDIAAVMAIADRARKNGIAASRWVGDKSADFGFVNLRRLKTREQRLHVKNARR